MMAFRAPFHGIRWVDQLTGMAGWVLRRGRDLNSWLYGFAIRPLGPLGHRAWGETWT